MGFSDGLAVKNPARDAGNAGDVGSIPGSGRSPGGENGNPRQDSWLENPMDKEPGGLQSMGSQRVGQDRTEQSRENIHICTHRKEPRRCSKL